MLSAWLFGEFRVEVDGRAMSSTSGLRPRSLLAYLDRCLDTSDAVPIPQQMQWDYK